jgi:hypothetical protein
MHHTTRQSLTSWPKSRQSPHSRKIQVSTYANPKRYIKPIQQQVNRHQRFACTIPHLQNKKSSSCPLVPPSCASPVHGQAAVITPPRLYGIKFVCRGGGKLQYKPFQFGLPPNDPTSILRGVTKVAGSSGNPEAEVFLGLGI